MGKFVFSQTTDAEYIAIDMLMKLDEEFRKEGIIPKDVHNFFFTEDINVLDNNYRIILTILLKDGRPEMHIAMDWPLDELTIGEQQYVLMLVKFFFWKYAVCGITIDFRPEDKTKEELDELETLKSAKEYAVARQDFQCASLIRDLYDRIKRED